VGLLVGTAHDSTRYLERAVAFFVVVITGYILYLIANGSRKWEMAQDNYESALASHELGDLAINKFVLKDEKNNIIIPPRPGFVATVAKPMLVSDYAAYGRLPSTQRDTVFKALVEYTRIVAYGPVEVSSSLFLSVSLSLSLSLFLSDSIYNIISQYCSSSLSVCNLQYHVDRIRFPRVWAPSMDTLFICQALELLHNDSPLHGTTNHPPLPLKTP